MIILVGKFTNKGSSLPGKIAKRINKKIMQSFTLPNTVIAVTGSSGKGSTSKMIAKVYRELGYTVAHNIKGSNLADGILTLLLENCTLTGKIKKDVLVYEVDERYTKYVFKDIHPNYVVITNLTRDQPPRQGHFDLVFKEIKKALTPDMHLVLNGDDPYLQKFTDNNNEVAYYGIGKHKYISEEPMFENLNLVYCPVCETKLKYHFYHFENIGDYYCPKCDFKRPAIKYCTTSIDYKYNTMKVNKEYNLHLSDSLLFAMYNTLAAFTACATAGLDPLKVSEILSKHNIDKKIFDHYSYKKRTVYILNNKNENSTTFNHSLLFLNRDSELKTLVIGWKEISRRYNFDDLSWLYDINFELLKKHDLDKIICVGINAYDIATRLKYAGLDEKKIIAFKSLDEAKYTIKDKSKGNIYAILNFDYVEPFNQLMKGSDK
jgi:UDP-N-acetylmuramoylalanine-D-glutamate ligase